MKVAFLDRDGGINEDVGYTYKIEDFNFIDGSIEALQLLQVKGFSIIVVTNQSGIGRGYYTELDYQRLTDWYVEGLSCSGVNIVDVLHCPHTPEDGCNCRKPLPGLFEKAAQKHVVNFEQSFMVGDKLSDIEAAERAGIAHRYLVGSEYSQSDRYRVVNNLLESVCHRVKGE